MTGWIKLYRSLLESDLWHKTTPEQKCIAIAILLSANYEEGDVRFGSITKKKIVPGQFKTGISQLAEIANGSQLKKGKQNQVSERNVRTALVKFQKMGFIQVISSGKKGSDGRLIKILNWKKYQLNDGEILGQIVDMGQKHLKKGDNVFDNVFDNLSEENRQRLIEILTTELTTFKKLSNVDLSMVIEVLNIKTDNLINNLSEESRQRLIEILTTELSAKLTTSKKGKEVLRNKEYNNTGKEPMTNDNLKEPITINQQARNAGKYILQELKKVNQTELAKKMEGLGSIEIEVGLFEDYFVKYGLNFDGSEGAKKGIWKYFGNFVKWRKARAENGKSNNGEEKPKVNWTSNRNIAQMKQIWENTHPAWVLSDADKFHFGEILNSIGRIIKGKWKAKGLLGYSPKTEEKIEIWTSFVQNVPDFITDGNYGFQYIAKHFPHLYRQSESKPSQKRIAEASADIDKHIEHWQKTTFLTQSEYDIEQLKKRLKTGHTLEYTKLLIEYIRNTGYDNRFYRMEHAFGSKYSQLIKEAVKWEKYGKPDEQTFWYIKNGKEHLLKGQKAYV